MYAVLLFLIFCATLAFLTKAILNYKVINKLKGKGTDEKVN